MLNLLTTAGFPPDQPAFWIMLALVAVLAYFFQQWRTTRHDLDALRMSLEKTRISLAAAEAKAEAVDGLPEALAEERRRREMLEKSLAAKEAQFQERERALEEMHARIETELKATTADMLDHAHKAFFSRTKETFERYQHNADVDSERRRKALDEMLKPVSETLARYEKGLSEMRTEQVKSRGELKGQIGALAQSTQDVRAEAQKLAPALRAGPKTRGRWGEEQLRNVVEVAGMTAYVDFVEQASHHDGDKRKQPDMIVNMPGERVVAVDSKVSLNAYLDALEAESDEARTACLNRHADDLWAHVKALSAKDYAGSLRSAMDYVIMFVPGENYFAAAVEARPSLYQDAFDKQVLIATPTILVAMLKAAAYHWRQEKMTENAHRVAAMAKDLYDSLRRMGESLSSLGKSLQRTVKDYDTLIGNVEGRVLPRARRFAEYELPGTEKKIEPLEALHAGPRMLTPPKDEVSDFDSDTGHHDAA